MLPFSGQGSNQGIEGSGILGELFRDAVAAEVPKRAEEFDRMRWKRITTITLLSRIRFGQENDAAYTHLKHDRIDPQGRLHINMAPHRF